jgi:hypothetical protein
MITNHKRRLQRLEERIRPPSGCPTCAGWIGVQSCDTETDWCTSPRPCPTCGEIKPITYTHYSPVDWTVNNCDECGAEVPSTRAEILANLAGTVPCLCAACANVLEAS